MDCLSNQYQNALANQQSLAGISGIGSVGRLGGATSGSGAIDWQKAMFDQMMQSMAFLLQRTANIHSELMSLRAELDAVTAAKADIARAEDNLIVSCTERTEPVNFDRIWSKSMARF